jgi:hypothetical protein
VGVAGECDLVAKTELGGAEAGFLYASAGKFRPDRRALPPVGTAVLELLRRPWRAAAGPHLRAAAPASGSRSIATGPRTATSAAHTAPNRTAIRAPAGDKHRSDPAANAS